MHAYAVGIAGEFTKCLTAAIVLIVSISVQSARAADISSSVNPDRLVPHRQTTLGLYLTSKDAHNAVSHNPSIIFIDVRTTAEFGLVGHPSAIDRNIPFASLGRVLNTKFGQYGFERNPHFVSEIEEFVTELGGSKSSDIILICRSGGRSRNSVNLLANSGFTRVWNVVDGFEGGTDDNGHRTIEGWRHDNLPWTYRIEPGQAYRANTR
jgi:rhodanese-related sulfurtransferase